jgi:hypothetical protein
VAVVVPVGGAADADRRKGFVSGREATAEEVEAYNRRREQIAAENLARHPSQLRLERERLERERETARKAACPDARGSLRAAHALRAEAASELHRIEGLRGRAADLIADLTTRQDVAIEALRQRNAEAAQTLVAAIESGADRDALPISPRHDAAVAQVEALRSKLSVARAALGQLDEQVAVAKGGLEAAERSVSIGVLLVSIDFAVDIATEIGEIDAQLHQRRVALWSLSSAITDWQRRVGPDAPYMPPTISRAVAGVDGRAIDSAWSARLKRLHDDPEAEL